MPPRACLFVCNFVRVSLYGSQLGLLAVVSRKFHFQRLLMLTCGQTCVERSGQGRYDNDYVADVHVWHVFWYLTYTFSLFYLHHLSLFLSITTLLPVSYTHLTLPTSLRV